MWKILLGLVTSHISLPWLVAGMASAGAIGLLVWEHLKAYWQFWVPALLVILNIFAFHGWEAEHNLLLKEQAAHKADITNFATAQATANAAAQAEKSILVKESQANADQADARYSTLLSQYRTNLVRYQANQSGTSPTQHYQLPAPQGGNGPGGGPELPATPASGITITMDDAGVCATNTARLQAVHDWAVTLPKEAK